MPWSISRSRPWRPLVRGMPYVFVKDTVSFNVPSELVPLHRFGQLIEISVRYSIDVVQRGCEGMVIGIFREWSFVFYWPIFLLLWTPSLLVISSPLVLPLLAFDSRPKVIFLVSLHSCFAQGLLGIFQLHVLTRFHVELVYTSTFLLLELVLEWGLGEHVICKVS